VKEKRKEITNKGQKNSGVRGKTDLNEEGRRNNEREIINSRKTKCVLLLLSSLVT
jgi:hypothetical protein